MPDTIFFTFDATQEGERYPLLANVFVPEDLARNLTGSGEKRADRESPVIADFATRAFLQNHPYRGNGDLTITRMRLRDPSAQIMISAGAPDLVVEDGIQIWYCRWIGKYLVRASQSHPDSDEIIKKEQQTVENDPPISEQDFDTGYDR